MIKSKNMSSKKFRLSIAFMVLLLVAVSYAFSWTLDREYMLVTSTSLGLILILLSAYLYWYLNKVNRDLTRFFQSFRFSEDVARFNGEATDSIFKNLYEELNRISEAFRQERHEKEKEHLFFKNTIDHIGVGILAFDREKRVELHNKSLLKQLGLKALNHLDRIDDIRKGLSRRLENLQPGQQEVIRIPASGYSSLVSAGNLEFLASAREFKSDRKSIKLISFQDIRQEIEERESEAWQKLLRIITHEIMNSVSPINLLTASLIEIYEMEGKARTASDIDDAAIEKTLLGLHTIKKRGQGLAALINTYKSLRNIPPPAFTDFGMARLLEHLKQLFQPQMNKQGIHLKTKIFPEELKVYGDEKLIEQVCINLINNSVDALQGTDHPCISISAGLIEKRPTLSVSDNGKGIREEEMDQIFVPFYTGHEGGTGLGLPLCRQIMNLHRGSIKVWSDPGIRTVFSLTFP
jgi:two-component system nitrogen regulation sensor histidine kinase NtrY